MEGRFRPDALPVRSFSEGGGNYTVYVNPYLVLKSGGYTKHYYIEGQRIVSKLGGGWDNKNSVKAGGNKVDYVGKAQKVFDGIVKNLKFLGADGQVLTAGKSGQVPPGQISGSGNVAEPFRYFCHPDHLGSTSYVTDASGEVYQHMEYFAFGETFVDEHSNTDKTPYLFNGKELDEETGLYYYGARYYDARTSVWTTVDPLTEQFPNQSPYNAFKNSPVVFTDPDGRGPTDDHYINDDGSIQSVKTDDDFDGFYVQDDNTEDGYRLAGQLNKNEDGLVQFPGSGEGFNRYGGSDTGGTSTSPSETVGQGDHYLKPETAAALYGLINYLDTNYGFEISFGDMSSSNGSDPWQAGFQHHAGHGHLGKRSGLDVDFRYLNSDGTSFQSSNAFKNSSFSSINNQRVYDAAVIFGFTKNYQGTSGSLTGVTNMSGHNDHGHLGLQHQSLNWKYVSAAPTRRTYDLFNLRR